MESTITPKLILDFWFENEPHWFMQNDDFDQLIHTQFGKAFKQAQADQLNHFQESDLGLLALIIIFDQFSRNLYRNTPNMYATDQQALALARQAIEQQVDRRLPSNQHRQFLYMPFMHSEHLADQNQCITLFEKINNEKALDYAKKHQQIIATFDRFPHRNAILGRQSTEAELKFLEQPGSHF